MLTTSKSYHYLRNAICFLLLVFCLNSFGQSDLLIQAQTLCNEKKYSEAIPLIEKIIVHQDTKDDATSWYIRSYANLQVYKQGGKTNFSKINLLDTVVISAVKSQSLDKDKLYVNENKELIKSAASNFYKACTILLQDSLNSEKSEIYYSNYKKTTSIYDPTFDFKAKDIEYYNAMGGIFEDMYMKSNFNQKHGDIAKYALLKVLELDSKNIRANINLGVLYYNQGATLMRMMDYDVDLAQLDVIQENAKKLFKQSLPFMIKVYELDPQKEQALESLQGIYSALLDDEKANEFKQKKEALNKK